MSNNSNSATPGQDPTQPACRKSGRAAFGDDGRSIWEWQTSTGVFTRDITDEQLTALEAPHLALVDPSEAVTIRRSQTQRPTLASVPVSAASRSSGTNSNRSGKLRRLLRRVARIIT